MMDDIKGRLKTINQKNGFLFDVTDIVDGTSSEGIRKRGVALERSNGSVIVHCNAQTRTLAQMQEYITKVLDEEFIITGDGLVEPFVVTPKPQTTDDTEDSDNAAS